MTQRAHRRGERLFEIFDAADGSGTALLPALPDPGAAGRPERSFTFERVSFAYPGDDDRPDNGS